MSLYGLGVGAALRRLPDVGDALRSEISDTLGVLSAERPTARWRELLGVAWLGVRLRTRVDTGAAAGVTWQQGLHRGGSLLLAATSVEAVAFGAREDSFVVAAGAAAILAATWTAVSGRRLAAVTLAIAGAILLAVGSNAAGLTDAGLGAPFGTRLLIGAAAVAAGAAPDREHGRLCPWRWLSVVAAASALTILQPGLVTPVVGVVLTGVVPGVWLLAGAADPRLAVGAATAFFWRFIAIDAHQLRQAIEAAVGGPELEILLVRWIFMGLVVAAAVLFAHNTIRRSSAL